MESETLKPCPLWHEPTTFIEICERSEGCHVECRTCGCRGPQRPTRAEAIAAWNTRPTDPVIEAAQKVADEWKESDFVKDAVTPDFRVLMNALAALLPPNSANSPVIPEGSREWRVLDRFAMTSFACTDENRAREIAGNPREVGRWRVQFSDDSGKTWQDAPETPNAQ